MPQRFPGIRRVGITEITFSRWRPQILRPEYPSGREASNRVSLANVTGKRPLVHRLNGDGAIVGSHVGKRRQQNGEPYATGLPSPFRAAPLSARITSIPVDATPTGIFLFQPIIRHAANLPGTEGYRLRPSPARSRHGHQTSPPRRPLPGMQGRIRPHPAERTHQYTNAPRRHRSPPSQMPLSSRRQPHGVADDAPPPPVQAEAGHSNPAEARLNLANKISGTPDSIADINQMNTQAPPPSPSSKPKPPTPEPAPEFTENPVPASHSTTRSK